jgi:hypothetical protein
MFPISIGKESNSYEDVEQGTIHDWDEVRSEYYDPRVDPWRAIVVPVLKEMKCSEVANLSGVSERHIARLRNLREKPSPELRERLTKIASACDYARPRLGEERSMNELAACAWYLKTKEWARVRS